MVIDFGKLMDVTSVDHLSNIYVCYLRFWTRLQPNHTTTAIRNNTNHDHHHHLEEEDVVGEVVGSITTTTLLKEGAEVKDVVKDEVEDAQTMVGDPTLEDEGVGDLTKEGAR
jgi:hypothetical protein